ncbi:hypothetical protein HAX54_017953 [Datura stramonium]|uniref:Uncharacterized protein n=1 Tax=Datura stramonium TaxID=4076 RepID=A0ABS8S121_DATST|nr:hypothetical protein [Datura stramonium]
MKGKENKGQRNSNTWGDKVEREEGEIEVSSEYQTEKEQEQIGKSAEVDDKGDSTANHKVNECSNKESAEVNKR